MADAYVKRPNDVRDVPFDFSTFVARVVAEGVVAATIQFLLRAETGLTITSSMPVIGLINLSISGGVMGRVYDVGISATTLDGDSEVQMTKIRVRDPSLFPLLTGDTLIATPGSLTWDAATPWDSSVLWS